ncbi:MAG: class I SAM-dependent methyltransferase [Planctomycetota bacterium]|nr:class I SAM-dependent methyltransferase [Planctomycetota bacterium]
MNSSTMAPVDATSLHSFPLREPFDGWAQWYDLIYQQLGRDPVDEIAALARMWQSDGHSRETRRIVDVGCGTGRHCEPLRAFGSVTGIDSRASMLNVARGVHPQSEWIHTSLEQYAADIEQAPQERFDVVVALFGVVGYSPSIDDAELFVHQCAALARRGGCVIIEVEFTSESIQPPVTKTIELWRDGAHGSRLGLRRTSNATIAHGHILSTTFDFEPIGWGTPWHEVHNQLILPMSTWRAMGQRAAAHSSVQLAVHFPALRA